MVSTVNERTNGRKSGELLAFPLAARVGDIERCARELDRIHGNAAIDYWKTECRKLAQQLSALGLPDEAIRQQILEFQAEVQAALAHRYETAAVGRNRSDGSV